jgi:hypothetical protein
MDLAEGRVIKKKEIYFSLLVEQSIFAIFSFKKKMSTCDRRLN